MMLAVLIVACSRQPEAQTTSPDEAKQSGLLQADAKKLATVFRDEWLKDKGRPSSNAWATFETFVSAKSTASGWHVVFGSSRNENQPEGQETALLHIYIDSNGKLEKVEEAGEIS